MIRRSTKPLRRIIVGLVVSAMAAVAGSAIAQSDPPPFAQARDGELSSAVLVTSDSDWQEKWNTAVSNVPQLKSAGELKTGETAVVLIFLSGLLPAEGRLKALCSIEIRKPNGITDTVPETVCYDEMSLGQRKNVLLADARVEFRAEASDPAGLWLFRVVVRDANTSSRTASEVGVRLVAEGAQQ